MIMQEITINNVIENINWKQYLKSKEEVILIPNGNASIFEIFGEVVRPSNLYGVFKTSELRTRP